MKKRAAKTILMLTGMLMLALSVLPHHHHGNAVCFASTEYCSQCKDDSESAADGHDHGEKAESCNVRQLFVMSCRDEQISQQDPIASLFPDDFFIQPYALPAYTELQYVTAHTTVEYPPFAEPIGSRSGGTSFSLRAPPAFIA